MIKLLEYSYEQNQFHYNNLNNENLSEFDNQLFTNSYYPICIVTDELRQNTEFFNFIHGLKDKKISYERMYTLVNIWVMNWIQGRKLKLEDVYKK